MTLRRTTGAVNDHLELLLYRAQYQLVTTDALYSDGDRYTPAIAAVKDLKEFLPSVKQVLVLGTGLASLVRVMRSKGYAPHYTLVEMDKVVLGWAMELLDKDQVPVTKPVCADAAQFIQQDRNKYDLVFIDIFFGRVVPGFVTTQEYMQQCKDRLEKGGHIVFNYIINDRQEWERVWELFSAVFPGCRVLKTGINRILVGAAE